MSESLASESLALFAIRRILLCLSSKQPEGHKEVLMLDCMLRLVSLIRAREWVAVKGTRVAHVCAMWCKSYLTRASDCIRSSHTLKER